MSFQSPKTFRMDALRVLVVDDNRHMRTLIKSLFYAMGCKLITECSEGSEALEEMKTRHIDLIICDWAMKPIDGLELLKMIRTAPDSPNPDVPLIMLTGHTERERVIDARDAGVTEFLAKPISAEKLYSRVMSALTSKRHRA